MSLIKTPNELKLLRVAGDKLGQVIQSAFNACSSGMSGVALDGYIRQAIREVGATPSFLGYDGYPNASCISVNSQVVHGIPTDTPFREGDVIGIDIGLWYQGVCVDSAVTKILGTADSDQQRLLAATKEALLAGIKAVKPYRRVGVVSHAIQQVAETYNLGIVKNLTGHGVGHHVHEPPDIPNYGSQGDGIILRPGMVLAIEPMFTLGAGDTETEVDGWGVVTSDGSQSAHFEHTVIVTNKGAEIITKALANV